MNAKKLTLLIAVAVLALIAAFFINRSNRPQSEVAEQAKPLLPQLHGHVNDVSAITLTGAGDKVLATLARGKDGWSVTEKSGYPADLAKIREFLLKLDAATLIEQKTANPKLYAELGVDDVEKCGQGRPLGDSGDQGGSQKCGILVDIAGLAQPLKLIVGNYNGAGGGGTFVRRADDAQSWLVKGNLTVAKNTADWEKRDIAEIASSRLKSIALTNPDGKTLKLYKDQPGDTNFKLADVPKGREASSEFAANGLGSVLSGLKADDVFVAKDAAPGGKVYKVEYVAFDGLIVNATGWEQGGKDYAQFAAKFDTAAADAQIVVEQAGARADYEAAVVAASAKVAEEKSTTGAQAQANVKAASEVAKPLAVSDVAKDREQRLAALNQEVEVLNQSFSGWSFVLPSYKFADMTKTMDDMLKPLETKKSETKPAQKPPAKTGK